MGDISDSKLELLEFLSNTVFTAYYNELLRDYMSVL